MQQLHVQPAAVASATITGHQMHRADDQRDNISQIMGLPPIGGRRNELPVSQRLLAISRIAFIAALMLIASVILIQGILILLT